MRLHVALLAAALLVAPACPDDSPGPGNGGPDITSDLTDGDSGTPDRIDDGTPEVEDDAEDADGGPELPEETVDDTTDADASETTDDTQDGETITCTDSCPAEGERMCADTGEVVLECADEDDDGCVEWTELLTCGAGTVCDAGTCSVPSCPSQECTAVGAKKCGAANDVLTCDDFDADGCLEWGGSTACVGAEVCSNGVCSETCSNECTAAGAKDCDGDGNVVTCGDYNSDGCYEWGSAIGCAPGLVCSLGICQATCQNECTAAGAKQCDEGGSIVTCGDYNGDGCYEWGSPVPCQAPLVCANGACASQCTEECAFVGAKQCSSGGSGDLYEVCGDYDADPCLEWGTPQPCDPGLVCSGGNCASTCSDDCPSDGATQCSGNGVQTCGNFDGDACLEWGTAVACETFEECVSGACEQLDPPAQLVIAEILVNSDGSPDTEAFIELYGPAGTDLTGYSLVAINGNGGGEYATIVLSGATGADGLFVVAHSQSTGAVATAADQFDDGADLQNGPDSVELRFGGVVVDAVGYGSFGGSDVFAGEGSAAPAPGLNESISRSETFEDTDDNAADFTIQATPSPGEAAGPPNQAPVAALSCPAGGTVGVPVSFDAAASTDDAGIADYAFDFGDGTPAATGAVAQVNHTYGSADSYTVTLTVTDEGGLQDTDTCTIDVTDADGPSVTFIKPIDGKQVTQGETVAVLVDANPAPGKSVTQVELLAGGAVVGTDTSAPYEFDYVVPGDATTGSNIPLVARATDDSNATGLSETRNLYVWNDPPQASFVATVSGALQVTMDASSVSDTETSTDALEVRWDYENDGTWDTAWSTTKIDTHVYPSEATYTIAMEVRDGIGQVASTTRDVTLSLVQNVSGTVTTTTWAGTVVITGDVTVPSGETLTVSAGTSVLFAPIDQGGDGVGDYDIEVDGALIVEGTEAEPVVFTTYGSGPKSPADWNRIHLDGDGSSISHAVIEYAATGLDIDGDTTLSDVEVRFSSNCVRVRSGATTWTTGEVRECVQDGIWVSGGQLTATSVDSHDNGRDGLYATGGTVNHSGSTIHTNGRTGIEFFGAASGLITQNLVTNNDYEGLRIASDGTANPTPVVNYNNVYGNAVVGARVVADVGINATSTGSSYTDPTSSSWATPNGEIIDLVHIAYTESDNSNNYCQGQVYDGTSNTSLFTTNGSANRWVDVAGSNTDDVRAHVNDNSSSFSGSMTISTAAYDALGEVREVSVVTNGPPIDAKHNFWGAFPNPLGVVTLGKHTHADIQGFTGVAFDDSWDKGPYVGGAVISDDQTWTGAVFVTGDVTVGASGSLTILEGASVEFADVDQDGNGIGDYGISVSGGLVVDGASTSPVTFGVYGSTTTKGGWDRILVSGASATSQIDHIVLAGAEVGFELGQGVHGADSVTLTDQSNHGVIINGTGGVTWSNVTIDGCGSGIRFYNAANVDIDGLTASNNLGDGLSMVSSNTSIGITNAVISNNGGAGVRLEHSSPVVSYSTISGNQVGVLYSGESNGSLTSSNIKFNLREGIVLAGDDATNPDPTITGNNIYGNSVDQSGVFADPGLSAVSTGSSYTDPSDGPWSPPNGAPIEYVRTSYSESDNSNNYIQGELREDSPSGTMLKYASSGYGSRFDPMPAGVLAIVVRVNDNSSSFSGTMSATGAFYYDTAANKELAAMTASGSVDVTTNYWGVFPDVQSRMTLARTEAVDFQGAQLMELSGTGPQ